jgi:hypothetical protein
MCPEELLKPEAKGNLPLHLAAKRDEPKKEQWEQDTMDDDITDIQCMEDWNNPYDKYNVDMIKVLAKACPEAAKSQE